MIDRRKFLAGLVLSSALRASAEMPRSAFSPQSTAEDVTAGLDLNGMTAVVTGCNSGIGFETMRVLALRGAHVIGTARTSKKDMLVLNAGIVVRKLEQVYGLEK